eukprot:8523254-Pyramimonas_sp.AAC.1
MPAGKGMALSAISQFGPGGANMDAQALLNDINFLGSNLHPSLAQQLWTPCRSLRNRSARRE